VWFYDEGWDEVLAFRKEAQLLEKEHLELRVALREAEAALRADPGNRELRGRVEELKRGLEEVERRAPWVSYPVPLEVLLWTDPHG